MIIDNHTLLLCLVSVWRITDSICSRYLCPAPIGRKMGHSSCQSRFIWTCFLNPSDDMRDQPVLVILYSTDISGGAPLFICQELCAYRVLSDPFTCIVWECSSLLIFKVTGDIWDVNSIFMCAAAPFTISLDVSSSTSSTSYFTFLPRPLPLKRPPLLPPQSPWISA